MRDQLIAAIEQRRMVEFTYQGQLRRVQPAAYGVGGRKGKDTLHAYQLGGGSRRGHLPDWRNFHVEQITELTVMDQVFGPNPPGFNPRPFPTTHAALAASPSQPATEQQPWGGTGGTGGSGGSGGAPAKGDQVIPGVPISAEQAAKAADAAAEAASKAFGALGKWLRKR